MWVRTPSRSQRRYGLHHHQPLHSTRRRRTTHRTTPTLCCTTTTTTHHSTASATTASTSRGRGRGGSVLAPQPSPHLHSASERAAVSTHLSGAQRIAHGRKRMCRVRESRIQRGHTQRREGRGRGGVNGAQRCRRGGRRGGGGGFGVGEALHFARRLQSQHSTAQHSTAQHSTAQHIRPSAGWCGVVWCGVVWRYQNDVIKVVVQIVARAFELAHLQATQIPVVWCGVMCCTRTPHPTAHSPSQQPIKSAHHITSHHITSHHITSQHNTPHHMTHRPEVRERREMGVGCDLRQHALHRSKPHATTQHYTPHHSTT